MVTRCAWVSLDDPLYLDYHDREWGTPLHDDSKLLEFLILEGAQAGLSWYTILKRRENYRLAFDNFDPVLIANYGEEKINQLLSDPGIIRNKKKILSACQNARALLKVRNEFGSFDRYIWQFVGGKTIHNSWQKVSEVPSKTKEAEAMSKDLIKRGFTFVGPTICYAFMQAVGLVNDHTVDCFRYRELRALG